MWKTAVGVAAWMGIVLGAWVAQAQHTPGGGIRGQVFDPSGGALPGVTITARNSATGEATVAATNERGVYVLTALVPGTYDVAYELPGFRPVMRTGVQVEAAIPLTIDVTMELGGLSETVVVEAVSPVLVTTPAVSRRLSAEELEYVPSPTRNYTHLLAAAPGVSSALPPVGSNDTGSISPSVNGAKATSNSLFFNGVDVTNLLSNAGSLDENLVPAPETLEEVKLQTSLYDASTGRSGGGSFQLVTRAGANTLTGSSYLFGQHDALNANDFFFARSGLDKPRMRRAEVGMTLGGPLKRNRAFAFGHLQWSTAETGYVPTASTRALLPAALALVEGERTPEAIVAAFRSLNPSFAIQPSQISPLALALLNARNPKTGGYIIPAPNGPTVANDRTATFPGFAGPQGGDPLAELRLVVPSLFDQLQGTLRTDLRLSDRRRLEFTVFAADFPSRDSFPDPTSMTSPWVLHRQNRAWVAAGGLVHTFSDRLVNETRAGVFSLRNTRALDDTYSEFTNDRFGIDNPARLFDDSWATRRLGHYVALGSPWSFGCTNDCFNRREQRTVHLSDALTWLVGTHSVRLGGDVKFHAVGTDLPEEQATEFEKISNFQEFLLGFTSEADTQFGFTQKHFRMRDVALFVADDWRPTAGLTLNLGVRWDWYGWPRERDGLLGNFDPALARNPENPFDGFVVPKHVKPTFPQIDSTVARLPRANHPSTIHGEDLNNVAPRLGFAYRPGGGSRHVVRGGYGLFYDRPSAAFMNTVFSNYPFLREIEIPTALRPIDMRTAFTGQVPDGRPVDFYRYFPYRVVYANGRYTIYDSTGLGPNGGNIAETVEFRAIDRNLKTPFYEQWNLGYQVELGRHTALEVRYQGSRGHSLLLAEPLNQPWDLNDPAVPRHILDRITAAYRAGGGGPTAQDPQALGYGYINPSTGRPDRNYGPGGRLIPSEARGYYMGFNDAEAIMLRSTGRSLYHALQVSVTRRVSDGLTLNGAYTWSRARDLFSADPGSTAGSGRPDEPNTGFVVENDGRNLAANWAPADFDRPHRVSVSLVWRVPETGPAWLRGWTLGAYFQAQSGVPFSVFTTETDPLMRLPFGRLDFAPGADARAARQPGSDRIAQYFNVAAFVRPFGPGNTPRNFLRGPLQKRLDLSLARRLRFGRLGVELRYEAFNLLNWVNLDLPENNFDHPDFGRVTRTVGGPFVSQVGVRVTF
jgi:hypothetical protein